MFQPEMECTLILQKDSLCKQYDFLSISFIFNFYVMGIKRKLIFQFNPVVRASIFKINELNFIFSNVFEKQ